MYQERSDALYQVTTPSRDITELSDRRQAPARPRDIPGNLTTATRKPRFGSYVWLTATSVELLLPVPLSRSVAGINGGMTSLELLTSRFLA